MILVVLVSGILNVRYRKYPSGWKEASPNEDHAEAGEQEGTTTKWRRRFCLHDAAKYVEKVNLVVGSCLLRTGRLKSRCPESPD